MRGPEGAGRNISSAVGIVILVTLERHTTRWTRPREPECIGESADAGNAEEPVLPQLLARRLLRIAAPITWLGNEQVTQLLLSRGIVVDGLQEFYPPPPLYSPGIASWIGLRFWVVWCADRSLLYDLFAPFKPGLGSKFGFDVRLQ